MKACDFVNQDFFVIRKPLLPMLLGEVAFGA